MALQSRLAGKQGRHDPHPKMALAGARRAAMAGVQMGFVDHVELEGGKRVSELLADRGFDGHCGGVHGDKVGSLAPYGRPTTVGAPVQRSSCACHGLRTYLATK